MREEERALLPFASPRPAAALPVSMARPGYAGGHTISLVIPTKNEAANIEAVLRRVPASVTEVIVVDGLSTDGTADVARAADPRVSVIEERRRGKGAAVRAGFTAATGEFIVMLDADGSMDPQELDHYVAALASGSDLVKGSRFVAGGWTTDMTRLRRVGNGCLRSLANALYGARFTELCYGFMALRRSAVSVLALDADGFEIEAQIVIRSLRAGLRVQEVPSGEADRLHGQSNLHPVRDGLRILRAILVNVSWKPMMGLDARHAPHWTIPAQSEAR